VVGRMKTILVPRLYQSAAEFKEQKPLHFHEVSEMKIMAGF
jgi:hypothetical protein